MLRALGIVVVVLAVLVDGFFALINFYPVAPRASRGPRRVVLVSLDRSQARWLQENLVAEFNVEHNSDVQLFSVGEEQLVEALRLAHAKSSELMLATLPRARATEAARGGLTRSFLDVAPSPLADPELAAITPEVLRSAELDGKAYFLPRYSLMDVLVFRISKVRDAVRHWSLLRAEIDAALRARNGHGLPPHYQLELDPEEWDSFDRFVIGYYWAHRRYHGEPARGRMAHRTGEELEGVVDLTEGIYRAGATDGTVGHLVGPAPVDYFAWEMLYREHGLYAETMFGGRPVGDAQILDGLGRGELFLATVDQMQAFTLHGGSHRGTPPRVDDPDDLGFAPLARISSLEVDAQGKPLRPGRAFSFREDWVWALPAGGADPRLAYELVKFLWEHDSHYRECEALGTLPLRADLIRERSSLFRLVWMNDIFDAVFAEWSRAQPVPDVVGGSVGSIYAQLWDRIVAQRVARTPAELAAALRAAPPPRQRPPVPPAGEDTDDAPASARSDEDSLATLDDDSWRGRVELEKR